MRSGIAAVVCLHPNEGRYEGMNAVLQYVLYLVALVALAIPLGTYIKKVMFGEKTFLSKILTPCENAVYRVMSVKKDEQMGWKKYAVSVLIFSGIGLIFLFLLQLLQGVLPGNPQGLPGVKWDLSFNTAASFVTNTNWQAYSGRIHLKLSYTGSRSYRAELCIRGNRYRRIVCVDSRLYEDQKRRSGQLLG